MFKKSKFRTLSLPAGIGFGAAVSIAVAFIGSAVVAALINGESLAADSIAVAAAIIHLAASMLGSFLATVLSPGKRLITAAITSIAYFLCMLGITALFFGGQYKGIGSVLLMVILGCAITVLLGLKGKRGYGKKHKIPAYR